MRKFFQAFFGYLTVCFLAIPWSIVAAYFGASASSYLVIAVVLPLNLIITFLILRRSKFMHDLFDIIRQKK